MIVIPAYLPYLALTLISLILIALSWFRSKRARLLPFYICIAGMIYLFELIVFVCLDSYRYMPGVFKDRFYDSCLGAVVSNGFVIPSACVFIAVYSLCFRWLLLLAIVIMGIEELFLSLGIYEHEWWRSIYTSVGVCLLFLIGQWLWRKLREPRYPFYIRVGMLYLINVSVQGTILYFYIALFHQLEYRPGWFEDPSRDTIAFSTLLVHLDSILFALLIALQARWIWKAALIAGLAACFLILIRLGILDVSGNWTLVFLVLMQIVVLLVLKHLYLALIRMSGNQWHKRLL